VSLKSFAKSALLKAVSAMTGRHAILLPSEAADEDSMLDLSAPYRVEGDSLRVSLLEPREGTLHMTLLAYEGHFPTKELWSASAPYQRAQDLVLGLRSGEVKLGDRHLGAASMPIPSRRFCWQLELRTDSGTKRRLTGHYAVVNGAGSYFEGDNYVSYEEQAKGDVAKVVELFEKYGARGPVLEIGCATGMMLEALRAKGFDVYGVDSSNWAVERARGRVGDDRVFEADPERNGLPEVLAARGPFQTVLLWAVLEHFRDPFQLLRDVSRHASAGAVLVINTTNADSLNHFLYGREWEGYFDPSHHGIDRVSVESLRRELPSMGWRIEELGTALSWDSSADPTRASFRELWASDARFRRLLVERERGDLVTCVAVKG
jgi:SAM-dependent methyltransferase